jgi:hypothetical protein
MTLRNRNTDINLPKKVKFSRILERPPSTSYHNKPLKSILKKSLPPEEAEEKEDPSLALFETAFLKGVEAYQEGKWDLGCVLLYRLDPTSPTYETHDDFSDEQVIDWLNRNFLSMYDHTWRFTYWPKIYDDWRTHYENHILNYLEETGQAVKFPRPAANLSENSENNVPAIPAPALSHTPTLYKPAPIKKNPPPPQQPEKKESWRKARITMGTF